MYIYSFEKLEVWQLSRKMVREIYDLTGIFPVEEKFNLVNQMRRASVSVSSNIAEGSSRSSLKDQVRFLEIAYGSLMELYTQVVISKDLAFINEEQCDVAGMLIREISNKINALQRAHKERLNNQNQQIANNNQINKQTNQQINN